MVSKKGCQQKLEGKSLQAEERKAGRNSPFHKKPETIKRNSGFREIFRKGVRKPGKNLTLIYIEKKGFRYGITFTKGARPAVRRNRTKRRLKEIIRTTRGLMKKDIQMVIHISQTGLGLSYSELLDEFTFLLKDARIIE